MENNQDQQPVPSTSAAPLLNQEQPPVSTTQQSVEVPVTIGTTTNPTIPVNGKGGVKFGRRLRKIFEQPRPESTQLFGPEATPHFPYLLIAAAYLSLLPLVWSAIGISAIFSFPSSDGLSIGLATLYAMFIMPVLLSISYLSAYEASAKLNSNHQISRLGMRFVLIVNYVLIPYTIVCVVVGWARR